MDEHLSAITFTGEIWKLTRTENEFRLEAKECFADGMTDETLIKGGHTIGQARRGELYALLEEWLEAKLKEKNSAD